MAWNIAGVDRRTRDAAVEAARRAGMRLDDWLDEAIADYAGVGDHAQPNPTMRKTPASRQPPDVSNGLPEDMRPQKTPSARGIPHSFDYAIGRFETRLARAEAQAARAFETVAQILERDDATRDSERRALIDAVRRLESIRINLTEPAQTGERRGERLTSPAALDPKPSFDLKSAVSQIAMRRHELEDRAGRETRPTPPDPRTNASDTDAFAPSPASRNLGSPDAKPALADTPAEEGADAATLPLSLLDDLRTLALKLDDRGRERADRSASVVDLSAMRAEMEAMRRSLADLAPRNAIIALEGAIRDLVQRVEMVRQSGHGESMLVPLEAMAAEFRAALKAHDPQAAVAGLEREIRAIGGQDR